MSFQKLFVDGEKRREKRHTTSEAPNKITEDSGDKTLHERQEDKRREREDEWT